MSERLTDTHTSRLCDQNWGLAALFSKANTEARSAERKVCFLLDAGDSVLG